MKLINELESIPIVCKICNLNFDRLRCFSKHLKLHKITNTEYSKIYILNNIIPKCQCGCGNEVVLKGFKVNTYLVGHTGGGVWQLKYDKDSEKFKEIANKISKKVIEHLNSAPRQINDQTRLKRSEYMKTLMSDEEEKSKRINKMIETKRKQSELGILSERHWTKKLSEEELNEKLIEIGKLISKSKKDKNNLSWNKGLTSETDDRIARTSGENNYRYNPNKKNKYTRKFRNKLFRHQLLIDQCSVCFKCKNIDGRQLCLHHIDENKTNDDYNNLIFVCRSCHIRIHSIPAMLHELKISVLKFKEQIKENKNGLSFE